MTNFGTNSDEIIRMYEQRIDELVNLTTSINDALETLVEKVGLIPGGVYKNPLIAIDAISKRWDETSSNS